jgi:hypothetical protein
MITKGKYMTISGKFVDTTQMLVATAIWKYHVAGIIGYFVDHEMTVRTQISSLTAVE